MNQTTFSLLIQLCNDPNVGLSLNEMRSYVKCYLGDTGLLVSHAFDENEFLEDEVYKQILSEKQKEIFPIPNVCWIEEFDDKGNCKIRYCR